MVRGGILVEEGPGAQFRLRLHQAQRGRVSIPKMSGCLWWICKVAIVAIELFEAESSSEKSPEEPRSPKVMRLLWLQLLQGLQQLCQSLLDGLHAVFLDVAVKLAKSCILA